jgi:hypothetical protein
VSGGSVPWTRSASEERFALQQTKVGGSHAPVVAHVKSSRTVRAHSPIAILVTIALLTLSGPTAAQAQSPRVEPNVQHQLDQLERQGSVDPTTRRQLQDQLRRQPQGPRRWAAERRLERLSENGTPARTSPRPEAPASDPLPSSLSPGFVGSGGGPGTSGYMVPPGGRTGGAR